MDDAPLHKRSYAAFVSYSHADSNVVDSLVSFLGTAGLAAWRDKKELGAAASLATALPQAIRDSRSALFVVSRNSAKSGWVNQEYKAAISQQVRHPGFRIIAIRVDDTDLPDLLEPSFWLDLRESKLDGERALALLTAFHGGDQLPPPKGAHDVYLSFGWRPSERESVREVCRSFLKGGYRLVGDANDYPVFDSDARLPAIIKSCGALLGILPNRNGKTSKYIVQEIQYAREAGVPYMLVSDDGLPIPEDLVSGAIEGRTYPLEQARSDTDLQDELVAILDERFEAPKAPHYAFFGGSLTRPGEEPELIARAVETVTALPCVVGAELQGLHAQAEIIRRIKGALFMLADITGDSKNTLIEAGVARGAGTPLFLLAQGEPTPTRFMFRDLEVAFYGDTTDLLSSVHRLVSPFRRRVLNHEMSQNA